MKKSYGIEVTLNCERNKTNIKKIIQQSIKNGFQYTDTNLELIKDYNNDQITEKITSFFL